MRVLLCGAGQIGAVHATSLAESRRVSELVITDLDMERAQALAARVGARALALDEAFALDPDAVVIGAPTPAHAAARPALDRARDPVPLREAALGRARRVGRARARGGAVGRAGPGRVHAALRPGAAGAARPDRRRRPRSRAHAAGGLTRSRAAGRGVRRPLGRDVPRPADPRLRHDPLGHGLRGAVGLRGGRGADDRLRREVRRRRHLRARAPARGRGVRAAGGDARGRPRRGRADRGGRLAATAPAPGSTPARRCGCSTRSASRRIIRRTATRSTGSLRATSAEVDHFLAVAGGEGDSACTPRDALNTMLVAVAAERSRAARAPVAVQQASDSPPG